MSDDIIEQLRQREREISERIAELTDMRVELAELAATHRKTRKAIAALEGATHTSAPAGASIAQQVLSLLRDTDRAFRVAEIAETLALETAQARSAVAYLNHKGEVRNVQRGLWTAAAERSTVHHD